MHCMTRTPIRVLLYDVYTSKDFILGYVITLYIYKDKSFTFKNVQTVKTNYFCINYTFNMQCFNICNCIIYYIHRSDNSKITGAFQPIPIHCNYQYASLCCIGIVTVNATRFCAASGTFRLWDIPTLIPQLTTDSVIKDNEQFAINLNNIILPVLPFLRMAER